MQSLLKTADQLKIKGLCEPASDEKENHTANITAPFSSYSKIRKSPPKQFKTSQDNNRKVKLRKRVDRTTSSSDKDEDNASIKGTVITSDEENDMPDALNETKTKRLEPEQTKPLNMSSHGIMATGQVGN